MKPDIIHSKNFVEDAADFIERAAWDAFQERGEFRLALSGGNTPKPIYTALASRREIDWHKVIITFGDERCVPPDDAESNYHMARESLLDLINISPGNVLRMKGEIDPEKAAEEYEAALHRKLHTGEQIFHHDLILLGMGPDGHTASLFPGTEALAEKKRWVVSNYVPAKESWRITFTYPLIEAARHVCFLVNSAGKDQILEEVFSGTSSYPCASIQPKDGKLTWLLGA